MGNRLNGLRMGRTGAAVLALAAAGATPAPPAPAAEDAKQVQQWVAQLSDGDPGARLRAAVQLESLPTTDLPLLEAASARHDLPSEASEVLGRVVPRARQRAKRAARLAETKPMLGPFYTSQALSGYDNGGHTNPKWDDAARAFLRSAGNLHSVYDADALTALRPEAVRQMTAVLALGCDDPTVLAAAGLLTGDTGGTRRAVADLFARASDGAVGSPGTAPLYRMIIDGRMLRPAAQLTRAAQRARRAEFATWLQDLPVQYGRLLAAPGLPPTVAIDMARLAFDGTAGCHAPLKPILDGVIEPLEQALPNEVGAQTLKGEVLVSYAWEARGAGYANTVTPQGAADFQARLAQAKEVLSKAWHADPDDASAADEMLTVARGGEFDRPTMEMWYRRAIAADPDDYEAADRRLTYLEPKWLGDPDAMLQFGHECLADGNFRSRIPSTLVEAHYRLANHYAPDAAAYWLRPGVWDDVRSVYEGYLALTPGSAKAHSQMARFAVLCHQWKVADAQFKLLGDRAVASLFGSDSVPDLEQARATAARLADSPDQQGK